MKHCRINIKQPAESEIDRMACYCVYKMRYQPMLKMKVIFSTELAGKDDEFVQAVRELTFKKLKSAGAL